MSEMKEMELTQEQEEQRQFICDSDQAAEWCLRKKKEAEEEKAFWKDYYAEQYEKVCRKCDWTIGMMEYHLFKYFETVPHKKAKASESYQLPSGKLTIKEQKPEWEHDDDQLLPWVKENVPGMIKTKESVDWAELKKELSVIWHEDGSQTVANGDGLIVPGVTVTERPDKFVVEVK